MFEKLLDKNQSAFEFLIESHLQFKKLD